jgi:hypothetical protein
MESQLSLHLKAFNNRVKVMNQTNAKELTLSKLDAQNLQADIFELLAQIQELAEIKKVQESQDVVSVQMDGGDFR